MGVVARPSDVMGLVAISIMAEMTFMPERHSSSNFSQTTGESGLAWRLISNATVFAMSDFPRILQQSIAGTACSHLKKNCLFRVVTARTRLDVLNIDCFVFKFRSNARSCIAGLGRLQELLVVAIGEVGF